MNLLIVGSVATDTIDTPHGSVNYALGGSATYASIAASYFADPGIVGVVGNDFDKKNIALLKRKGIDLDGLQIDNSGKTFHWSGYYEGDMNQAHTRKTELNVFEKFSPKIPENYRSTEFLMLGNIHPILQLEVLSQMKKTTLTLCDTMNFWISSEPELVKKVFSKVDVVCINDAEACQFTGESSLPKAAKLILKLGPRRLIIKKGGHGVLLFGKSEYFSLPSIPLEKVVDPTGAGDSFAGGFIGYMTKPRAIGSDSFRRALAIGTVMASYCVEGFSCKKTASLTTEKIYSRVAILKEATRLPFVKFIKK